MHDVWEAESFQQECSVHAHKTLPSRLRKPAPTRGVHIIHLKPIIVCFTHEDLITR